MAEVWLDKEGVAGSEWLITRRHQNYRDAHINTIAWWEQPAQKQAYDYIRLCANKYELKDALHGLYVLLAEPAYANGYYLWGNGADFDLAILWHALDDARLQLPNWNYSRARCLRTLRAMYPQVSKPAFKGIEHTAMADACNEAQHLQAIYNYATLEHRAKQA
jgi:hypothetical protein